jgi:hypothetical protein
MLSVQFNLCCTGFPTKVELVELREYFGAELSMVVVVEVDVVDVEVVVEVVEVDVVDIDVVVAPVEHPVHVAQLASDISEQ